MSEPNINDIIGTDISKKKTHEVSVDQSPRRRRSSEPNYDDNGDAIPSTWGFNGAVYWGVPKTYRKLPAGTYNTLSHMDYGATLTPFTLEMDDLVTLPNKIIDQMISEFDTFWKQSDAYEERGFVHKRGSLYWGPPAGGKTSMVNMMARRLVNDRNGVVIYCNESPQLLVACLANFRHIEKSRPVIIVLEDIDAIISQYGESALLALLDGSSQINHCFFLATTNYPEKLDRRIINRPSRFDSIIHIGMPSAASRRKYLKDKEPILANDPETLEKWVEVSKGFSLAHLKEMIISVLIIGQSLDETVARLESMHRRQPSSEDDDTGRSNIGFFNRSAGINEGDAE